MGIQVASLAAILEISTQHKLSTKHSISITEQFFSLDKSFLLV